MTIYRHDPLEWPGMLLVHPGREFMGSVSKEMKDHRTFIRRGCTEIHGDRASAERFNKTVVEMLFSFQYGQQIVKTARPASWAKRLLEVVAYCSEQIKGETRLTGKEKNHQRKESLRRNAKDLLGWPKKNFPQLWMYGFSTSLANWKEDKGELSTPTSPWKSIGCRKKHHQNRHANRLLFARWA